MQLNAYEWLLVKLQAVAPIMASAEIEELGSLDPDALRDHFWGRQAERATEGDPASARACLEQFATGVEPHPAVAAYVRQALQAFVRAPGIDSDADAPEVGAALARAFGLQRQRQGKPPRPAWMDLARDAAIFDLVIRIRAAGYRGFDTWDQAAHNAETCVGEPLSAATIEQYWKRIRGAIPALPIWTESEAHALDALLQNPSLLCQPEDGPPLSPIAVDEQRAQCELMNAATVLARYLRAAISPDTGPGRAP